MDELDRPRQRNATIFTNITGALAELGINRTLLQVRDKFKKLKYLYLQERKRLQFCGQSSRSQFRFWEEMHRLMGDRPVAVSSDHLLESSSSQTSCEIPAPSIQYGNCTSHHLLFKTKICYSGKVSLTFDIRLIFDSANPT
ncbi:UNVERIFIED_CONTAM: hypothetical protein FKN15_057500 [Acipenser sinensis]